MCRYSSNKSFTSFTTFDVSLKQNRRFNAFYSSSWKKETTFLFFVEKKKENDSFVCSRKRFLVEHMLTRVRNLKKDEKLKPFIETFSKGFLKVFQRNADLVSPISFWKYVLILVFI